MVEGERLFVGLGASFTIVLSLGNAGVAVVSLEGAPVADLATATAQCWTLASGACDSVWATPWWRQVHALGGLVRFSVC